MKTYLLAVGICVLSWNLARAQPDLSSLPADRPLTRADLEKVLGGPVSSLKRFNLDFPGGTPGDLVKAIEKAGGQPLNTIIPEELANRKLPAFTVKNVTVVQVFEAVQRATTKLERYAWTDYLNPHREPKMGSPVSFYFDWTYSCGFKTDGPPTPDSIWVFYVNQPEIQHDPVVSRFYQLAPYLEAGCKVDDIISSIDTTWKMRGLSHPPQMYYHRETKLLIVVGEAGDLKNIEDVLAQLPKKSPEKSNDKDVEKSNNQ